ncbi:MAG: hypothetical protein QM234_04485 [Acidobacteriota bacterium]|nr:hypothetical protein [Acidobacteriota bacterium]
MTTTKITHGQLKVLKDAYKFEKMISDGPEWIALETSARPQWEDALTGDALEQAKELERELFNTAWYLSDPESMGRQMLDEITREALELDNSIEVLDMYNVWELEYFFERVLTDLRFLQARTEIVAPDLGQDYDHSKRINTAIGLVDELYRMVGQWEYEAAQRFVKTGSARPDKEATK